MYAKPKKQGMETNNVTALKRALGKGYSSHHECLLTKDIRLFRKSTATLSLEKLQEVTAEYRALRYPNGAVQLPLQCAKDWDADNHGRDYWQSERLSGDERRAAYKLRRECYECVTQTLRAFDEASEMSRGKEDGSAGTLLI